MDVSLTAGFCTL